MPPLDNLKGMRVAALMEIRHVEGKVLWFPTGTLTGASDVDDEDMYQYEKAKWEPAMIRWLRLGARSYTSSLELLV